MFLWWIWWNSCKLFQKRPRNRSFLTSDNTLNFWYSGGERTPLYNRPRMNEGYAIFATNGYDVHTQLPLTAWYSLRESNPQRSLRSSTYILKYR